MLALLNGSNLNAAAALLNADSKNNGPKAPAGITTTADAALAQLTSNKGTAGSMGEKDFLTLFTTQLKNQNPLDPVKNEAFVAQLAQFSQLQATTTMADTLKAYVDSMAGQQMLNSASMIGKQVLVPDAPGAWDGSLPIQGAFNLAQGADAVRLEVLDAQGNTVTSQSYGPQKMGEIPFAWGGMDSRGQPAPKGYYSFRATVTNNGKDTTTPVSVYATVNSVTQATDRSIQLNVAGGKSIKLTDVNRISG